MSKSDYNRSVTCVICGKEFYPEVYHVYKMHNNKTGKMDWCCSYSCMNKLRDLKDAKKRYITRNSFEKGDW